MRGKKRFRRGAFIGFGAGYVLGAKAGRERYEELRSAWQRLRTSDAFRRAESAVRQKVGMNGHRTLPQSTDAFAPHGYEAERANLEGPVTQQP